MANRIDRQIHKYRHAVQATITGGGAVVPTGYAGDVFIPFACEPDGWFIGLDQVGSVQISLWADVDWPPTAGDDITALNRPTVSGGLIGYGDSTGWPAAFPENTVLRINVESVAAATRVLLVVAVKRLE